MPENINRKVVDDFGKEWARFDQSDVNSNELLKLFHQYFFLLDWKKLPKRAVGFDLGCGSGRWAMFCAPKVEELHCIEPSNAALKVAKQNLSNYKNCIFHEASVDNIPIEDNSMDFGYSLGVLHHVPETEKGIKSCVKKLKSGAPLLIYLYYALENRPLWYKIIWKISNIFRRIISIFPYPIKYISSQIIALMIYLPFTSISLLFEKFGINVNNFPLANYRDKSFYTMRTDALDRFGTRLEQRFTRSQIKTMMLKSGLENIEFSEPYWCAIGYKSHS